MSEEAKIDYPYMPGEGRVHQVSGDDPFIQAAHTACIELSTDHSHPNGSVIVLAGKIVGQAGNKGALKNPKLIKLHSNGLCVRRILHVPTGKYYWLCPGCASFKNHSEALAIKDAQSKGHATKGAQLYMWGHWWSCKPCWDKMLEAGIKQVFTQEH